MNWEDVERKVCPECGGVGEMYTSHRFTCYGCVGVGEVPVDPAAYLLANGWKQETFKGLWHHDDAGDLPSGLYPAAAMQKRWENYRPLDGPAAAERSLRRRVREGPHDWDARMIWADALDETGRPGKASYQRWASLNRKSPQNQARGDWRWVYFGADSRVIPPPLYCRLEKKTVGRMRTVAFGSRDYLSATFHNMDAAEDALFKALTEEGVL